MIPGGIIPETIYSEDHRQVRSVEGAEELAPPFPITEPLCDDCGHGATAHTLMGRGTCHGDTRPPWQEVVRNAGRDVSACPCVRFRFPKRA